ncbi:MAG: ARPP-1 family domain-containing protein, partial [Planctomycetota bacterium]
AVYLGKRFLGFDLFDRASTFRHYWKSLIDGYALDWLAYKAKADDDAGKGDEPPSVDDLVETLSAAPWERFEAPGEGSTVRWEDKRCTASALAWGQDSVVHLQAFPRLDGGTRLRHTAAAAVPVVPAHTGPVAPRPPSVPQRQGERTGTRCERCGFLYGMVKTHEGDYCNHCGHPSR